MAGNLLRTRVDRAPFLSRWIVDLDRSCLHFHHRHHRGQNSRPRHHMWLFRSRQQKLEFHRSYRARFVTSRGADCALHLRAPTRTLVLTARLEPVCRDIVCLPRGGSLPLGSYPCCSHARFGGDAETFNNSRGPSRSFYRYRSTIESATRPTE